MNNKIMPEKDFSRLSTAALVLNISALEIQDTFTLKPT